VTSAYDITMTSPGAGLTSTNLARVVGDTLNLAQTPLLAELTTSPFNTGGGGKTGSVLGVRLDIEDRDNTIPDPSGAFIVKP
jgi:hypothetical protein